MSSATQTTARRRRSSSVSKSKRSEDMHGDLVATVPGGEANPKIDNDAVKDEAPAKLLVDEEAKKKWSSWWRRVLWSWVLVIGFNALFFVAQQAGMVLLIVIIQGKIYKELVSIAINYNRERELPGFNYFYYYWFAVVCFFAHGRTLLPHLLVHDVPQIVVWIAQTHKLLSFSLYMIGVMAFVISLQSRRLYKYQFQQFAYCHMALLAVVGQSTLLSTNAFEGMLWFFLPVSMIVCNDCFAYIFGFFFGRTPLIKLSPKKTWEGFLGAFFVTVLYAFFATRYLQQWPFMTCPRNGFATMDITGDCGDFNLKPVYVMHPVAEFVPDVVATVLPANVATIQMSAMQVHAVVMAVFASLVAPFGGFFASGFKRAFKIKDFANDIPGHGGFTDRFDCQIAMGAFAYVYFHSVVVPRVVPFSVGMLFSYIRRLPESDQRELLLQIKNLLGDV